MSAETETSSREGARPSRPATDSIADGVRSRTTYAVSLDMFEGPLDLLLHLVRRHELDILDIPIAFITEKYIEYISFARSLDIEIAGEYLLMAATLAFLKSRELLPAAPGEDEESEQEEEGVDPREELIRRLIEYERFREAGDELGNRPLFGRDVFPRGGSPDVILPEPGLAPVTLFRLAEAYNRVLDRAKIREEHTVVIEPVTVRQRMRQLSLLLSDKPRLEFESLFLQQVWSSERELRQMLVVTLMSVLEMVKLGLLGVYQAQGSDTLELERTVEVDEMTQAVSVFREEGEEDDEPLTEVAVAEGREAAAVEVEAVEALDESSEAAAVEVEAVGDVELEAVEQSSDVEAVEASSEPIEASEPAEVSSDVEAVDASSESESVEASEPALVAESGEPESELFEASGLAEMSEAEAFEASGESEPLEMPAEESSDFEAVEESSEPEPLEASAEESGDIEAVEESSEPEPLEASEAAEESGDVELVEESGESDPLEAFAEESSDIEAVEESSEPEPLEASEAAEETSDVESVEESSDFGSVEVSSEPELIDAHEPEALEGSGVESAEDGSDASAEVDSEPEEPPEQEKTLSPDEGETE